MMKKVNVFLGGACLLCLLIIPLGYAQWPTFSNLSRTGPSTAYYPYNFNMPNNYIPNNFGWNQTYNYGLSTPWAYLSSPWNNAWSNPLSSTWISPMNSSWNNLWNNPLINPLSSNPWQTFPNYIQGPQSYNTQWSPFSPGYTMPNYSWTRTTPPVILNPQYPSFPSYPPYDPSYPRNSAYTSGISGSISDESLEDEEYLVYSALIEEEYDASSILILNHTYIGSMVRDPDYDDLKETFEDLEESAVEDYLDKNDEWYYLEKDFDLDDYQFISLNQQVSQNLYYVIRLSRVGFNSDGDQALVYAERTEASLAGAGYYFFLIKEDGVWKVEAKLQLWIA